jgi:hypothetical protein
MKNLFSSIKAKILAFVGLGAVAATNAAAAVTVSSTDGSVSGSLELGPFFSMFALVIVAAAAIWAAKRGLALLRG